MTKKEKMLAGEMLILASEEFSNHTCNDVDEDLFKDWSVVERQELCLNLEKFNNSPEDYDPNSLYVQDWELMNYFAHKLRTGA